MAKNLTAIIDLDAFKYDAAAVGENRYIKVSHPVLGEMEFPNRTEFWGHYLKKAGGKLAEINEGRDSPYLPEEFTVEDVQEALPFTNVSNIIKGIVDNKLRQVKTKSYKGYIGKGDSFRLEKSTLMKYKGNRDNVLRPILLDEVSEFLRKEYNAEVVTGIEVDDQVVIDAYKRDDRVVVGVDKDFYGCPILYFNTDKIEEGIVNCNGFGELVDGKKVRGKGRLWLYFQIASGDVADNYKANCMSSMKWGDKAAYNALKDCKNDKEALECLVAIYQLLYPEPKVVQGWRGDDIEIDWMYVLEENFQMAKMLYVPDGYQKIEDTLNKLKII